MKPCKNQVLHDPPAGQYGDCHRCCVAAILELDPLEVPHYVAASIETGRDWPELLREWLEPYGFGLFRFAYHGTEPFDRVLKLTALNCPGLPLILCGASPGGTGHAVVIMDGKIVMDPVGCGVVGPLDGVWTLEAIGVGPAWGGRRRMIRDDAELQELAA